MFLAGEMWIDVTKKISNQPYLYNNIMHLYSNKSEDVYLFRYNNNIFSTIKADNYMMLFNLRKSVCVINRQPIELVNGNLYDPAATLSTQITSGIITNSTHLNQFDLYL